MGVPVVYTDFDAGRADRPRVVLLDAGVHGVQLEPYGGFDADARADAPLHLTVNPNRSFVPESCGNGIFPTPFIY